MRGANSPLIRGAFLSRSYRRLFTPTAGSANDKFERILRSLHVPFVAHIHYRMFMTHDTCCGSVERYKTATNLARWKHSSKISRVEIDIVIRILLKLNLRNLVNTSKGCKENLRNAFGHHCHASFRIAECSAADLEILWMNGEIVTWFSHPLRMAWFAIWIFSLWDMTFTR